MKKAFPIFTVLLLFTILLFGQKAVVSADKNNELYIEVDNPLTVVVENYSCSTLVVKTDNGKIVGKNGYYNCRPESIGPANISVFIKNHGKLKKIKEFQFRVKYLINKDNIRFCIATCSNPLKKSVLLQQQFVRAEVTNTEFDMTYTVDSFDVEINNIDSLKIIHNIGNKISKELHNEFSMLMANSTLVFKNIYSHRPKGDVFEISPVKIIIY